MFSSLGRQGGRDRERETKIEKHFLLGDNDSYISTYIHTKDKIENKTGTQRSMKGRSCGWALGDVLE